jgi:hypothetical protein
MIREAVAGWKKKLTELTTSKKSKSKVSEAVSIPQIQALADTEYPKKSLFRTEILTDEDIKNKMAAITRMLREEYVRNDLNTLSLALSAQSTKAETDALLQAFWKNKGCVALMADIAEIEKTKLSAKVAIQYEQFKKTNPILTLLIRHHGTIKKFQAKQEEGFLIDAQVVAESKSQFAHTQKALKTVRELYQFKKETVQPEAEAYRQAAVAASDTRPPTFVQKMKAFFLQTKKKFIPESIGKKVRTELSSIDSLYGIRSSFNQHLLLWSQQYLTNPETKRVFEEMITHREDFLDEVNENGEKSTKYIGEAEYNRRYGLVLIKVFAELGTELEKHTEIFRKNRTLYTAQLERFVIVDFQTPTISQLIREGYERGMSTFEFRANKEEIEIDDEQRLHKIIFRHITKETRQLQSQQLIDTLCRAIRRSQDQQFSTSFPEKMRTAIYQAAAPSEKKLFVRGDFTDSSEKLQIILRLFNEGAFISKRY